MGQCDRPPGNEDMSWQPCSQKRFTCTDYRITIGQERDSSSSLQMQPCYRHRRGELSKSCSYPCFTLNASIPNYGMLHTHCDVSYTACTARHEAVHSCEDLSSNHYIWLKAELKQVLVNVKFPCFKFLHIKIKQHQRFQRKMNEKRKLDRTHRSFFFKPKT